MALRALALNCTLKPSPAPSSTDRMIGVLAEALAEHDVVTDTVRVVDHDVRPGVESDEGDGDAWPEIRRRVVDADILVLATPIWMGSPSSVAKRVCERLDAFLGETDDAGRMPSYSKVAVTAIVGNEDGAHRSSADLYQWLADVGFTIPANAVVYWVGEAMGATDFIDLDEVPETTTSTARQTASNAAHLARLLAGDPYPGVPG
jgi:multimeric flavodoxin WrbA